MQGCAICRVEPLAAEYAGFGVCMVEPGSSGDRDLSPDARASSHRETSAGGGPQHWRDPSRRIRVWIMKTKTPAGNTLSQPARSFDRLGKPALMDGGGAICVCRGFSQEFFGWMASPVPVRYNGVPREGIARDACGWKDGRDGCHRIHIRRESDVVEIPAGLVGCTLRA